LVSAGVTAAPVPGTARMFWSASDTIRMRSTCGLKSKPKLLPVSESGVEPTAVAAPVVVLIVKS
jgi:hypothetical protein